MLNRGWKNVLEEEVQRVAERQDSVVEEDLVLVDIANDVHHDIGLVLVQNDTIVVEDDIACLLRRLLNEALLESLLRLEIRVGTARCIAGSCWRGQRKVSLMAAVGGSVTYHWARCEERSSISQVFLNRPRC